MLMYVVVCGLAATFLITRVFAKREEKTTRQDEDFRRLQLRYLAAFLFASFPVWFQRSYDFRRYSSPSLHLIGHLSSAFVGTVACHLADVYDRRALCVLHCLLHPLSTLLKTSPSLSLVRTGFLFGGISDSILCSVFESWYLCELVSNDFPRERIRSTLSKSTFYNASLAILSAVLFLLPQPFESVREYPILVSAPCSLISAVLIRKTWNRNVTRSTKNAFSDALKLLKSESFLRAGTIQSAFECASYLFIFSTTPLIPPTSTHLALVYSSLVLCLMIGSSLVQLRGYAPKRVLFVSVAVACSSSVFSSFLSRTPASNGCVYVFMLFEVSRGAYYPAVAYLRSVSLPGELRATAASLLQLPANCVACFCAYFLSDLEFVSPLYVLRDPEGGFVSCGVVAVYAGLFVLSAFVSDKVSRGLMTDEVKKQVHLI